MWNYEKRLQYPVNIKTPNAKLAQFISSQYGGPDGEIGASMRYLSQRFTAPNRMVAAVLNDVGTEELAHLEIVSTIVHQLTKDLSMEEIVELLSKETGNAITYVDESVEEAYESRKKWPAQNWEYDAWVSTYTAIKVGEQAGVSTDVEKVLGHPASSLLDILRDRKLIEEKYD